MNDVGARPRLIACAGLIVAPALWAASMQLGLILPYAECGSRFRPLLVSVVVATLLVLGSGFVSWRAPWPGRTGRFTAQMCALLAAVFAYAMLLQVLASAMLTGCER